jgi:hypothetical protein
MEEKPNGFDISRPISIKLQSPEGVKEISLRFPSDEEWIERARRRKTIIKNLGRGRSETIIPDSEELDTELIAKCRNGNEGSGIDAYEASYIIEKISEAEVEDILVESGGFRVMLRVPGGLTEHFVKMPAAKDIMEFRRGFAKIIDLPFNRQSISMNLNTAAVIYKRIAQESKGYVGPVPVIHQAAVVKSSIDAIEAGMGVTDSENF